MVYLACKSVTGMVYLACMYTRLVYLASYTFVWCTLHGIPAHYLQNLPKYLAEDCIPAKYLKYLPKNIWKNMSDWNLTLHTNTIFGKGRWQLESCIAHQNQDRHGDGDGGGVGVGGTGLHLHHRQYRSRRWNASYIS